MDCEMMIALSTPLPGREDEFNAWYSDRHVPDVLRIPGVVAAQRYRLSPHQRRDPPYSHQYLTLYQVEPGYAASVMAELKARAGTELLLPTTAIAAGAIGLMFEPMS